MQYDWFDRAVWISAAILLGAAGFYGAVQPSGPRRTTSIGGSASAARICADLAGARASLDAGKGPQAIERLTSQPMPRTKPK